MTPNVKKEKADSHNSRSRGRNVTTNRSSAETSHNSNLRGVLVPITNRSEYPSVPVNCDSKNVTYTTVQEPSEAFNSLNIPKTEEVRDEAQSFEREPNENKLRR
ncbi:hypothetical protein KIN20_007949 [Parelaphostrongylus tenuis]|uniref:Uncharacterized protein n=1 Tax=Parelaphostrongylus tenuis TaxID=148309 RepID=A0AAD5MM40_PARTN|nr:hypothetical protein KIN20_007949 [Parelaphostrongylus tenuis]